MDFSKNPFTAPVVYEPTWLTNGSGVFWRLASELQWVKVGNTPRMEYYCNDVPVNYTYGSGAGERTYAPQPWHPVLKFIQRDLEVSHGCRFEALFLNYYPTGKDHLGWHADDSPEMDNERPICIVSLGAEREIYFRPNESYIGKVILEASKRDQPGELVAAITESDRIQKLRLGNGSLCVMPPGMQLTHQHKIPKSDRQDCGGRISLTYRGYKK